jgi:hypothetical protein
LRHVVTALLGLIALVGPALAQGTSPSSLLLASRYDVAGTNPDGSRYSGTLAIEVISNTTTRSAGTSPAPCTAGSACA